MSPFESQAQKNWMFANKPEMAERWAKETPNMETLPKKARVQSKTIKGKTPAKSVGVGAAMDPRLLAAMGGQAAPPVMTAGAPMLGGPPAMGGPMAAMGGAGMPPDLGALIPPVVRAPAKKKRKSKPKAKKRTSSSKAAGAAKGNKTKNTAPVKGSPRVGQTKSKSASFVGRGQASGTASMSAQVKGVYGKSKSTPIKRRSIAEKGY